MIQSMATMPHSSTIGYMMYLMVCTTPHACPFCFFRLVASLFPTRYAKIPILPFISDLFLFGLELGVILYERRPILVREWVFFIFPLGKPFLETNIKLVAVDVDHIDRIMYFLVCLFLAFSFIFISLSLSPSSWLLWLG